MNRLSTSFFRVVLFMGLAAVLSAGCGFVSGTLLNPEPAQWAGSSNNLKRMGLVFKIYANDQRKEYWPPLSKESGQLIFKATEIAGPPDEMGKPVNLDLLGDTTVLVNPGAGDRERWLEKAKSEPLSAVNDQHYIYLGYVIRDDADMDDFTEAYLAALEDGGVPDADMEREGKTIYRLREGVARIIEGASTAPHEFQAETPVMMERPGVWSHGKVAVLFMDGHVERVPPGEFPNTEQFWANVVRIDAAAATE